MIKPVTVCDLCRQQFPADHHYPGYGLVDLRLWMTNQRQRFETAESEYDICPNCCLILSNAEQIQLAKLNWDELFRQAGYEVTESEIRKDGKVVVEFVKAMELVGR